MCSLRIKNNNYFTRAFLTDIFNVFTLNKKKYYFTRPFLTDIFNVFTLNKK